MSKHMTSIDAILGLCTYVIPAYGRRYNTEDEVLAALNGGKDFQIFNGKTLGPYWSIRDWEGERLCVITHDKAYDVTDKIK